MEKQSDQVANLPFLIYPDSMKFRFEEVYLNPQAHYGKPHMVLEDEGLSCEEKIKVLQQWKAEAIHMQESTAEGFDGGEQSQLDDVTKALHELETHE